MAAADALAREAGSFSAQGRSIVHLLEEAEEEEEEVEEPPVHQRPKRVLGRTDTGLLVRQAPVSVPAKRSRGASPPVGGEEDVNFDFSTFSSEEEAEYAPVPSFFHFCYLS